VLAVSLSLTAAAMRRTSTTFDEITLVASGARGYANGHWEMVSDHPHLLLYLYGLPSKLMHANLPSEERNLARYEYCKELFFNSGNDPERLAFWPRLFAVAFAAALVLVVFFFTRRAAGPRAGLLAAALVAFLPDVLGHGGVAYEDVPLAFANFAALWAIDGFVRAPDARRAAAAGLTLALALCTKFSAVALLPSTALLCAAEAALRGRDRRYYGQLLGAVPLGLGVTYLAMVCVYRGDFRLGQWIAGLQATLFHISHGHPSYLLGKHSLSGFWYFYPVTFVLKTPVALHALLALALLRVWDVRRGLWRAALASPLRAPLAGLVVWVPSLLASHLAIGSRYALPLWVILCVLGAAGCRTYLEPAAPLRQRGAVGALALWYVVSSASWYPSFLAFTSEYVRSRDDGYRYVADSSLDWGQDLLELRAFMRERHIPRVLLSYFGSALPLAYGIDYYSLPSYHLLPPRWMAPDEPLPEYLVISASNLAGAYLPAEIFDIARGAPPVRVLGHTLFVFRAKPKLKELLDRYGWKGAPLPGQRFSPPSAR
jgi:hypothetical protein